MTVLLNSEIFILTLVIGVYLAAVWLFRKTRLSILNPLLVSIPVLALITHFLGISYESFEKGSRIISFMLGPTVVVLGYLLYEQIAQLKENAVSIITSVFVGCITGVLSVIFIARYFGADHALIASLEPKSVTTPIAMSIAERSGGIPAIAAVVVIAFTRCMTIAITNARVYDDLRHLGASHAYLFQSVKGQVPRVFLVPAIVGTAVISAFYLMIMYFNDNRFTPGEVAGMGTCAGVVVVLSAALYGVYRFTRRRVCRSLCIG